MISLTPLLLTLLGCAQTPQVGPPDLRPAADLDQGCYDWPDTEFNRSEHPSGRETFLHTGDAAIDFTLKDVDGKEHRLAQMLEDKPVLIVAGSYTCNIFQKKRKAVTKLARTWSDDITTVVVYNVEAHPKKDPSPYRGKAWELEYSDRRQPDSYSDRVKHAKDVSLGGDVTVLVDALEEGNTNPFWCSYGACPNCAFLVNQEGKLEAVHDWFDPKTMNGSVKHLVERSKKQKP